MNLFVERNGKRIFAVSTRNHNGEAKLEILLEVECICSDDDFSVIAQKAGTVPSAKAAKRKGARHERR